MFKNNSETWLKSHDESEKLSQMISSTINERNKHPKHSSNHTKMSTNIRTLNGKLSNQIVNLSRSLEESYSSGNLTKLEFDRRMGLVNQLKVSLKSYERMLLDDSSSHNKESLFNINNVERNLDHIETEETMNYNSNQLLMQQDRILAEQDKGLSTLSHIISNQKQIAKTIGNEVDRQNVLIDEMDNKVVRVNDRIVNETRKVRFIDRKSSTCGIWMIVILLLIAIIVIVAIPKH